MHEWIGNEEDGYSAEVKPGGKQWFALYVSPIGEGQWSWSVTCMAPLVNIANHVDTNSSQPTSALARVAAEDAINEFLST